MRVPRLCVICAVIGLAGCGYSLGYRAPPRALTVAVPIFQNTTFPLRREIEYELTEAVRKEVQSRTSLVLADSREADWVIHGTVREYREPTVAEGSRDERIEAVLMIGVALLVEDYRNGRRSEVEVSVAEPFSPELGETDTDARNRAVRNLSQKILLAVESWEER